MRRKGKETHDMPNKFTIFIAFTTLALGCISVWFLAIAPNFPQISNEIAVTVFGFIMLSAFHILNNVKLEGVIGYIRRLDLRLSKIDGELVDAAFSPRTLTDYGKKISSDINAQAIAKEHKQNVALSDNPTEYEVQEKCLVYAGDEMFGKLNKETQKAIDDLAFSEGITRDIILRVVGFELRDLILSKHE